MNKWKPFAVGMVLLFFLFFYFFTGETQEKREYILEGVKSVDSLNEVNQFYYDKTPGLERAENNGLVTELDQTFELEHLNGFLHLDKIWNTPNGSLLFYNRDIGSIGENDKVPAIPSIERITFHKQQDQREFHISTSYRGMSPSEGIQFNGRYYHRVLIRTSNLHEKMGRTQDVSLPLGFSLNVNGSRSYVHVPNFPLGYDEGKEHFKTYPIQKTIDLAPLHAELVLHKLQVGYFSTKLHYALNMDNPEDVVHVDVGLSSIEQEMERIYSTKKTQTPNRISFVKTLPPLSKSQGHTTLKLNKIVMSSNESVSFSIDTSSIEEGSNSVEKRIQEKLGTYRNTDITFESYHYEPNQQFLVNLTYKTPETLKPPYIHLLKTTPRPLLHEKQEQSTFLVEAYNEEDELALHGNTSGGSGLYEYPFSFGIRKDIAKESDQIDISLKNIPYELVMKKEIQIPIKN